MNFTLTKISHLSRKYSSEYKTSILRLLMFIFFTAIIYSCSNDENDESGGLREKKIIVNNQNKEISFINESEKSVFYGLYSPVEVSSVLSDVDLKYRPELFLPTEWANEYTSSSKLALGLGLYGTDFSMLKLFSNAEDAIRYMEVISILSEKLGVPSELLKVFSARVEKNLSNIDSLSSIAFETFNQVSSYLIDSDREEAMSLILLGGWIEGLYFAVSYMEEIGEVEKKIIEKIIEQKYSLNILMSMLKNDYQDPVIAHYYRLLKVLQNHFDNLSISYKKDQVTIDSDNNYITSDWQQLSYSKSELDIIKWIVTGIREDMSNP